ncbi:magnesium transporter [Candidatus Babeliales bacterium]|nr:magnesium transporter [Candidatus Babeliales bacterium]
MVIEKGNLTNIEERINIVLKGDDPIGNDLWNKLLLEHPADIAELIERLEKDCQVDIIKKLPNKLSPQVFEHLPPNIQAIILPKVDPDKVTLLLQEMPVDELTDLFEYLTDEKVKKYLKLLQTRQRKQVISLLHFDPESAGGIMNSDVLTLNLDFTIKKSISLLQKVQPTKEHLERIYITDNENVLLGHIHIDDLVINKPELSLKDIVTKNELIIYVNEDQEEVAKQIKHYSLYSAPVVDKENHFLGIITADDVFHIIEEEASEDLYKTSGITPIKQTYFQTSFWKLIQQRSPWLVGLLLLQSVSGIIMAQYSKVIDKHTVLSFFITMLIGTGGNAGNQTGAFLIRGLATGEIDRSNGFKLLFREFRISIFMSLILSTIGFIRVITTHSSLVIATTISISLFLITIVSMVMGALLPLILERMNFDPANSAQPFLATLMDIIGIFIYCMVASKILGY